MSKKDSLEAEKVSHWESFKFVLRDCFKPVCFNNSEDLKRKHIETIKKEELNRNILKEDILNSKRIFNKPKKSIVNLKSKDSRKKKSKIEPKFYDTILKKYSKKENMEENKKYYKKEEENKNTQKLNKKLFKKIMQLIKA